MQWFQIKEKSAGKKRLLLTFWIYRFLGKWALNFVAFFIAFSTLIFSSDLRFYSKKYLKIIGLKPNFLNQLKHIYSYANSLADKIELYSGRFNNENIDFEDELLKEELYRDIEKKQGICFIFSHIGNIEILQSFFSNQKEFPNIGINVFLNQKQTKIFNKFIETIKKPMPIKYITDFDLQEAIKLKENLDSGEFLFIAGDRLAQLNIKKYITKKMFNRKVKLPKGTFQIAKLLDIPVYFISAVKENRKEYKIVLQKHEKGDMIENFVKYSENLIKKYPFQFYQFYDFFEDEGICAGIFRM